MVVPGSEVAVSSDEAYGDPSAAIGRDGDAMLVWVSDTSSGSRVMASHLVPRSGWQATPSSVSGDLGVDAASVMAEPPALVFDGETSRRGRRRAVAGVPSTRLATT
jgi:hypothetical protein